MEVINGMTVLLDNICLVAVLAVFGVCAIVMLEFIRLLFKSHSKRQF